MRVQKRTSFLKEMRRRSAPSLSKEVRASVKWKIDSETKHREYVKKQHLPPMGVHFDTRNSELELCQNSGVSGEKKDSTKVIDLLNMQDMDTGTATQCLANKDSEEKANIDLQQPPMLVPENQWDVITPVNQTHNICKALNLCSSLTPTPQRWRSNECLSSSTRMLTKTWSVPCDSKKKSTVAWRTLEAESPNGQKRTTKNFNEDSHLLNEDDKQPMQIKTKPDFNEDEENKTKERRIFHHKNDGRQVTFRCSWSVPQKEKNSKIQKHPHSFSHGRKASVKWVAKKEQDVVKGEVFTEQKKTSSLESIVSPTVELGRQGVCHFDKDSVHTNVVGQTNKESNCKNGEERHIQQYGNHTSESYKHVYRPVIGTARNNHSARRLLRRWTIISSGKEINSESQLGLTETEQKYGVRKGNEYIGTCLLNKEDSKKSGEGVDVDNGSDRTLSTGERSREKHASREHGVKKRLNSARCSWSVHPTEVNGESNIQKEKTQDMISITEDVTSPEEVRSLKGRKYSFKNQKITCYSYRMMPYRNILET